MDDFDVTDIEVIPHWHPEEPEGERGFVQVVMKLADKEGKELDFDSSTTLDMTRATDLLLKVAAAIDTIRRKMGELEA